MAGPSQRHITQQKDRDYQAVLDAFDWWFFFGDNPITVDEWGARFSPGTLAGGHYMPHRRKIKAFRRLGIQVVEGREVRYSKANGRDRCEAVLTYRLTPASKEVIDEMLCETLPRGHPSGEDVLRNSLVLFAKYQQNKTV